MEELKSSSSSHVPLVTRLDYLDHVMKSLEGRQDLSKSAAERQPFSLDSAAREAYFKGSLMDRVAILERRLFQLCIEMETTGRSSGPGTSSGSKSNGVPNHVIQFQNVIVPNHDSQVIKGKTKKEEKRKDGKAKEEKNGKKSKKGNGNEEKEAKNGGKKTTAKWPHMKILGC